MTEQEYIRRAESLKEQLYRCAAVYLGSPSDAVDEAFYKGFLAYSKLRQPEFFDTWLTRILINVCNSELRRRKRELGTYLLLGLSQGQVSRLLFLETGLIGLISLAAGLALGVAASFGMSALTLSMFEIDVSAMLAVRFSSGAAGKTVLYFGVIFLLVMALSGVQVSRAKLIDLIHGERKNEILKPRPLMVAVLQFVLGVICLLAAYAILLRFGMAVAVAVLPICIPMLTLGSVGTLLVFRSLSGFVMKFVQGHPGLYFKNLNVFTLRQWISKVHTTYLAQTVVCILLLLAIGITASSLGLNATLSAMTDGEAPFDITVQNQSGDVERIDFDAVLREGGFDPGEGLAWSMDTLFYYNRKEITGIEDASGAIKVSDLNALLARQGKAAYTGPLPAPLDFGESNGLATGGLGMVCVVIPDEMAGQLDIRRQVWSADYAGEDREETEKRLLQLVQPLHGQLAHNVQIDVVEACLAHHIVAFQEIRKGMNPSQHFQLKIHGGLKPQA